MRWSGMLAVGIVATLCTPAWGEPGTAPPILSQVHASWAGCDYSVWVAKGINYDPPYPKNVYRIFAQIHEDLSGTCTAVPLSILLAESEVMPTIAIVADEAGLVVGYSQGAYYKSLGDITSSHVVRLDPGTLGVLKHINLTGGFSPPGCVAGGPGSTYVSQLSIANHSDLIVQGDLAGNNVCAYTVQGPGPYSLGCTTCDGTGASRSGFSSTFPAFFTSEQAASITMY